jgi:hypothetical protein
MKEGKRKETILIVTAEHRLTYANTNEEPQGLAALSTMGRRQELFFCKYLGSKCFWYCRSHSLLL